MTDRAEVEWLKEDAERVLRDQKAEQKKKPTIRGRPRNPPQIRPGITISVRGVDEDVWEQLVRYCRKHRVERGQALNDLLTRALQ